MGDTKIQWADKVWNPVTGCSPISAGCRRCYAARMFKRLSSNNRLPDYFGRDFSNIAFHANRIFDPSSWNNKVVFVCSMGDLFHTDVLPRWRANIFDTIVSNKDCQFLVLTKRSDIMLKWILQNDEPLMLSQLPHVFFGVSVENQYWFERRTDDLLSMPCVRKWINLEPLLEPVNIDKVFGIEMLKERGVEWIACGGESGPGSVPVDADWVRAIRDQCLEHDLKFWFKQWGGKKKGNELDGKVWEQRPGIIQDGQARASINSATGLPLRT